MSTAGTLYGDTVGGGFAKLLNTTVISNGAGMVAISLPAGYDAFIFDLESIYAAIEGTGLVIRVSTDNGASWASANYYWAMSTVFSYNSNAWSPYGSAVLGDPHTTWLGWSHGWFAGHPLGGRVRLFQNSGTNAYSTVLFRYCNPQQTMYTACNVGSGWWPSGAALNAISFWPYATSFTSGVIRLYGMRKGT